MTRLPDLLSASPAHAEVLSALHGACFPVPWSPQTFRDLMIPGVFALIAGSAEPVGFILARCAAGEGEIMSIGVLPSARGQGIGRELVSAAAQRLAAQGAEMMFLEVAETNHAARSVYGAAGFVPVGRRKNYYRHPDGSTDDAIVMRRDLFV